MTISDEIHLKKLKEGRLNYQRVAFEQRIRRGETLVHKKLKVATKQTSFTGKQGLSVDMQADMEKQSLKENKELTGEYSILQQPDSCEDITTPNIIKGAKPSLDVSNFGCQQEHLDNSSETCTSSVCGGANEGIPNKKHVRFDITERKKESTLHSHLQSNRSSNTRHHGVIRGFLNSTFFSCSYNSFKAFDFSKNYKGSLFLKEQNCFSYTNEVPRTKRRLLTEKINMFKDTKLHASRTSLSMQRSLTSERLVPTNAMNTHDALVTNPMELIIHSKTTPFRLFLTKLKVSSAQKEVWKRCSEETTNHDGDSCELSTAEYCDILRENMTFPEYKILDHTRIMDKIYSFGVVGLKLSEFKENLPMLSEDTLIHWEYHLQILLNFKMIHAVGHYDDLLISPPYLANWCFRYPQVRSRFEREMTCTSFPSEVTLDGHQNTESTNKVQESTRYDDTSNLNLISDNVSRGVQQEKEISCSSNTNLDEQISSTLTGITYKNIKVLPWLKLNGELNHVILKRFHETVLVYIIANPGVLETNVLNHFALLLKPASARKILYFLEINGTITKHYMWKRKPTLFSTFTDDQGERCHRYAYFLPTMNSLLNMTDTNR